MRYVILTTIVTMHTTLIGIAVFLCWFCFKHPTTFVAIVSYLIVFFIASFFGNTNGHRWFFPLFIKDRINELKQKGY